MANTNKKYLEKSDNSCPHTGKLIAKELESSNMTMAEVARRIDAYPSVVRAYLQQPSLQIGILWRVGAAIGYHLLAEIAMAFSKVYPEISNPMIEKELQEKNELIAALEAELKVYKEIVQSKMGGGA